MAGEKLKFKKVPGGEKSRYTVHYGSEVLGTVESFEGTKTGFRHGRCVGQVACVKWSAKDSQGNDVERDRNGFMGRGSQSRYQAAYQLLKAYEKKKFDGVGV